MSEKIIELLREDLNRKNKFSHEQLAERNKREIVANQLRERVKVLHATCGQIMFQELKNGNITEEDIPKRPSRYYFEDLRNKMKKADSKYIAKEYAEHYLDYYDRTNHTSTNIIPITNTEFANDNRNLGFKIHLLRGHTSGSIGNESEGQQLPVLDYSLGLFTVEYIATQDNLESYKTYTFLNKLNNRDKTRFYEINNKSLYSLAGFESSLVDNFSNPYLDELNSVIELIQPTLSNYDIFNI